jgi:hypothetical protein
MAVRDLVRDSQKEFYAIDLSHKTIDLDHGGEDLAIKKYKISEAEIDGVLQHCASVYDRENDDLVPGLNQPGQRVVDFANILNTTRYHWPKHCTFY